MSIISHESPTKNYHSLDFEQACKENMFSNGLPLGSTININEQINRYSADNHRSKRPEWYVAFEFLTNRGKRSFICIYGSWRTGEKHEFRSWNNSELDANELRDINKILKQKRELAEKLLKEEHDCAAKEAALKWEESYDVPPSDEYISYARYKGIEPIGAKFGENTNGYPAMLIDVRNARNEIRTLQWISFDSAANKSYKTFSTGGEKRGNYHTIGKFTNGDHVYVVEGYATGVSVHLASKQSVVVAMDSGNIEPVINSIKKEFPNTKITIAGDSDPSGMEKAKNAAKIHDCTLVFPTFQPSISGGIYTDFNDLHQIFGLEEVRNQLRNIVVVPTLQDELKKLANNLLQKDEPCDSFQLSALPEPLRDYVASICNTTNAHPIMITCAVLTTISALVGKRVCIDEPHYFQKLYANIWVLNVTSSGQFKSTSIAKGAKLAFQRQSEVHDKLKKFNEHNKTDKTEADNERIKISTSGVILPNKITPEALIEHLAQGHNGAIFTGEFGPWLQNMDKSHNNDLKGIFTELFDVPKSYRYKTKNQGDHILEEPYISICGVSTLSWLKENLKRSDVESGFFARFLLFTPPHKDDIPPALPEFRTMSYTAHSSHEHAEQRIRTTLEEMDESYRYHFSLEAKHVFKEVHAGLYEMIRPYSDNCQVILNPFVRRWSPYIVKLAMLMQIFIDHKSRQISVAAIHAAMNIVLPAIKSTVQLYEGELGESPFQAKCRKLNEWLCKRVVKTGKPVTKKEILQSKQLDGDIKEYEAVLDHLVQSGKIEQVEKSKKMDWEYTPKQ